MESGKKRKIPRVKILLFLILIILFIFIIWSIFLKQDAEAAEFLSPVITIRPERGPLEKTIRITSQVESGRMITLVPRVAGTLMRLDAAPGTAVAADQLIAQVDSAPYNLTYLQARAAYTAAKSTFDRISGLYENQAATRQNFEEAKAAYEASRAQLELAELNLDYTNIRSPMDGVVLIRHATEGGMVNAGMPLVSIGDLDDLRIKAAVPEIHYRFFSENWETMPVRMSVRALGDAEFDLSPLSFAPYVSPENRSFLVEYSIPGGAERHLRPGMFASVSFILEHREDVYYLPFKVLASQNRLWYVDEDDRARFFEYSPDIFNDEIFRIPEDWAAYDFILEGQHFISPGQGLNIISRGSAAAGGSARR